MRAADGSYRWVLSRGRVVERQADGTPLRAVGTLTDLTDRRQNESQGQKRDLDSANHLAQSEFLLRMSHELRTPLNAVLGFAQLLKQRIGQHNLEEQRRYVANIEEAGWQLLHLVDDVLALSELEAGRLDLKSEPVNLIELLHSGVAAFESQATRKHVRLCASALPQDAVVLADERRLQQVVANLLSNAIKYNRPGGTVEVQLSALNDRWLITIADSGIGIPAAQLEHLFEPFNREGRRSSGAEGVGVGLMLSRSLLIMMGGRLSVQSTEGHGSSFEISLAMAADLKRS